MRLYLVYGDHGPPKGPAEYEEQLIEAESPEAAKEQFIWDIMLMKPAMWTRMGRNNVFVREID